MIVFTDNLFEPKEKIIKPTNLKPDVKEFTEDEGGPDFKVFFDLNLEIEQFRENLEASLENSDFEFVKKQSIIRSKLQEFRMEKRKSLMKKY